MVRYQSMLAYNVSFGLNMFTTVFFFTTPSISYQIVGFILSRLRHGIGTIFIQPSCSVIFVLVTGVHLSLMQHVCVQYVILTSLLRNRLLVCCHTVSLFLSIV